MSSFSLTTEKYAGPLETLLDLIEDRKLSISHISLSEVCDAYLAHIEKLPALPIGETAQFILVASTLLLIKSRSLLPTLSLSEDERESVAELEVRLARLAIIRRAGKLLRMSLGKAPLYIASERPRGIARPIFRPAEATTTTLYEAAKRLLALLPTTSSLVEASIAPVLALEEVVSNLKSRLSRAFRAHFSELTRGGDRGSLIVHFLAVLELVRHGSLSATQETLFGEIALENEETGVPRYGV